MKTNTVISNSDDIIDSRNIIERIEELQEEKDSFILEKSAIDEDKNPSWGDVIDAGSKAEKEWDETDDGEELKALTALQDELEGYAPDWKYGTTLIRDFYFTEYCKELANEIGDLPKDLPSYIENNINWDGVAKDLKVDYTSAEWDGVTYWVR